MTNLTPAQKITARLQAFNEQAANREIIEAHKAKVEAARAEGPSKESLRHARHYEQIARELKMMVPSITYEAPTFYERDITIEEGKVFGSYGWSSPSIKMPFNVYITFKDQYTQESAWRSRPNGKMSCTIGDYSDRKTFRELKDGTFNYYEMAREIFHRLQGAKAAYDAEQRRKANVEAVEQVRVNLVQEFRSYYGVQLSSSATPDKPVRVKIDTTKEMTVQQAVDLLDFLRTHDIG